MARRRADACPSCGADSRVYETRAVTSTGAIRRKRVCLRNPEHKWLTAEVRTDPRDSVVAIPYRELEELRRIASKLARLAALSDLEAEPEPRSEGSDTVRDVDPGNQ